MTKIKAVIESTASKATLPVRLDDEVHELHEEVKALLKKAGLGRLNMNRSLNPIIKSILMDAKYQAQEKLNSKKQSTISTAQKQESELA
ncbi:MAG: hypothetical protein CMD81_16115 [Gammaproteobacteria bacterium]|jgi:hypothetical protein|nr:hypothetical protein [Gammaproteobacteria bacterium]MBK82357.1 hypothetical protein [Gammaproteobacteria bacterium]MBK83548.1 hypothetical protein [Gammaproteobacteria bacterium]MBK85346.1 hypothetical protein [Gammaproteobacteria bacterium]HCV04052.1 hypothetical protein [Pseudoalteromonas sp.]|tara:strand:+ start:404 stop:670 length:267 start_codon:yes stop_codon:yes gene_type:complete